MLSRSRLVAAVLSGQRDYYRRVLETQPENLVAYWPLNEASGATAYNLASHSANLLLDASFDTGVTAATYWGLSITVDDGKRTTDAVVVYGNSKYSLKVQTETTGTFNTREAQSVTTVVGRQYVLSFWTQGDGARAGRYTVMNATPSIDNTSTGVTAAEWTQVTRTVTATSTSMTLQLKGPAAAGAYAYFDEVSIVPVVNDSTVFNGTYTNATLGVPGIGDGKTAVRFAGTGKVNLYTAALQNALRYLLHNTLGGLTICLWYRFADATAMAPGEGTQKTLFDFYSQDYGGGDRDFILLEKDVEDWLPRAPMSYFYDSVNYTDLNGHIERAHNNLYNWSFACAMLNAPTLTLRLLMGDTWYSHVYTDMGMRNGPILAADAGSFIGGRSWVGDLAHVAIWDTMLDTSVVDSLRRP